jgi:ribosomal protein S18 acetylase RimI-like enzyme
MTTLQSNTSDRSDAEQAGKGQIQITNATLDDVEMLVALHLQCFSEQDHIAVLFGESFIRAAYKWFVTDSETFILVAKKYDKLIGFTALADKPYNAPMLRAAKKEALAGLIRRPWLAFHPELLLRVFRMAFPKREYHANEKVAHIAFTAVDPHSRGLGVAKALKRESIRVCREWGMTAIVTGVRRQNLKAKAMNESAGFVEVPELTTSRFIYLRLDLAQEDQTE